MYVSKAFVMREKFDNQEIIRKVNNYISYRLKNGNFVHYFDRLTDLYI